MEDLGGGVDAGIGSAGDDDGFGDGGAGGLFGEGVLQDALYGATTWLAGPAGEVGSVVADVQAQTNEPALPNFGSDGLVSRANWGQDSSSDGRCDGGSWKPAASAASVEANHTSAAVWP